MPAFRACRGRRAHIEIVVIGGAIIDELDSGVDAVDMGRDRARRPGLSRQIGFQADGELEAEASVGAAVNRLARSADAVRDAGERMADAVQASASPLMLTRPRSRSTPFTGVQQRNLSVLDVEGQRRRNLKPGIECREPDPGPVLGEERLSRTRMAVSNITI
jgi:hypothetical protein